MFYPERRYGKGMLNFSERPQHYLCCGKIWTGQVCCWKNGKVKDCVIVQIVREIVRRTPMGRGTLDPWLKSRVGPIFYKALLTAQEGLPELHPFRGSTSSPEQVNMKAVTGACKLIGGCSLELCFAKPPVASSGIWGRKKSTQHDSIEDSNAQPEDSENYITSMLWKRLVMVIGFEIE